MAVATAAEYRRFARECLELAETGAPERRRTLVEMARAWHRLAQEIEGGALQERGKPSTVA
jgi:hypothetical protein